MVGERFGMLQVLAPGPQDKQWRRSTWRCLCDCGSTVVAYGRTLRSATLPNCGCMRYTHVSMAARKYHTLEDYLANTKTRGECMEWQGNTTPDGYGTLGYYQPAVVGKRSALVHRRVFELVHGYLPRVVRHDCDNPPCINPKHLLGGTHGDNTKDAANKGRLWSQKNATRVAYRGANVTLAELHALTGIPLPTLYWRLRNGKPLF